MPDLNIFSADSSSWDAAEKLHGLGNFDHGTPQLLQTDDGNLVFLGDAKPTHGGHTGSSGGTTGGTTGGTGGGTTGGGTTGGGTPPAGTLVGSSTGLQIDLIWDQSVLSAPNAADIENTVITAAEIYTSNFSTHAILNIEVGFGEEGGNSMGGALGQSQTFGIGMNYTSLTGALASADAGLVTSGLMASGAATAATALTSKMFFVANAEAKALGFVSGTSSSLDGAIGLGTSGISYVVGSGSGYDGVAVAAHEISEVMGRISDVGGPTGYATPLDVFRYAGAHTNSVVSTAGYFSTDMGVTVLNTYNNASNGGDAADWASMSSNSGNAYDAFSSPGTGRLAASDLLEVAALGYHPTGALNATTA